MSGPPTAEVEVLAPGNPIRLRGLPLICAGLLLAVIVMAVQTSAIVMLLIGGAGAFIAAFGVLDLLGTIDDPPWRMVSAPLALVCAATILLWLALRAAVAGTLSPTLAAFAIPGAMIAWLVAAFRAGEGPLHRRHGFWLLVIAIVIVVPLLGSHSLTDPWETHYGEVSREILARGDWITLWWAEDGWFQSKPILTFWLQAASMSLLGVRHAPGEMLAAAGTGATPHPEWALRMPGVCLMLAGLYLLYRGVAHVCGRRAAFIGGVALVTMPQFLLISRQAMTDIPFVAGMMGCLGCALLAAHTEPEVRAPISLFHVVFGSVLFIVMLQVAYLLSRNLMIATEPYFDTRFVADTFAQGSPGNCGSPGNVKCVAGLMPTQDRLQPAVQALIWLQATALLMWLSWGERRLKRLLYLAAWLCAALASMSKGIGGLALPLTAVFLWVAATGRWRELSRMEIIGGLILFAICALPWFAASYVRHGRVFVDRLFFDHMVKRTFGEMHHTNSGVDTSFRYYVWQLGYGTFPWVGLCPIALVSWLRQTGRRWSGSCMLAASVTVGFVLFSVMGTKFHHYSAPLLPALAMLTGILIDDMLRRDTPAWGGVAVGAAIATMLVGVDLYKSNIRFLHLYTYKYTRPWPDHLAFDDTLLAFTLVAGFALIALSWRREAAIALGVVACAFGVWLADVYTMEVAPHWGQRELFVRYERERLEAEGQVVAYQMNWKGENFYRGNRVPAFKTTGAKFQNWVDDQRRRGDRTMYFVTEHKRVASLKAELGNPRGFHKLTDEHLNNKFTLVRVRYR